VGDSTGRGTANALRRVAPGDLEVWDRTEHGCGMVAPRPECAGWRNVWGPAVALIDPDVVVVVLGASGDLVAGEDPPFHSPEATALRRAEAGRALDLLTSRGARVVWVLPAVPLPEATFFCGGRIPDTPCDPTWVDRWHAEVGATAAGRGVPTVDLRRWVATRPGPPLVDRPDGLHLTGPALDAQAAWLLPQVRPGRP
jgi:hypothetical protein